MRRLCRLPKEEFELNIDMKPASSPYVACAKRYFFESYFLSEPVSIGIIADQWTGKVTRLFDLHAPARRWVITCCIHPQGKQQRERWPVASGKRQAAQRFKDCPLHAIAT